LSRDLIVRTSVTIRRTRQQATAESCERHVPRLS
jgi:hypothetical protein